MCFFLWGKDRIMFVTHNRSMLSGSDHMELDKRRQMMRLDEAFYKYPDLCKRMGLVNASTFHGHIIATPEDPLSTEKEPA